MSKPAVTFQNPNPEATLVRARLARAASTSSHTTAASSTHSATWVTRLRNLGSRRSGALGGPLAAPGVIIELRRASADRRCVLQPALGPQCVQSARDLERRALADVALEHLAVISDMLDDAIHPILGQAELLAERTLDPEQALDLRIVGLHLVVDIRLGDVELLGVDHREVHPLDDVEPLIVPMPHERRERLLG